MNVAGISVLTRKRIVVRRFGSDAWARFYADVARSQPCFRTFITAASAVPLRAYLAFHDELMRRFFSEDEASYLELGRESSRWALTQGPLKAFLEGRDLPVFVASLPSLHKLYFENATTWSEASLTGGSVDFKVFDLPQWHPYFEHFIVGYVAEALEQFCANPLRMVRLSSGFGRDYHYRFQGFPEEVGTRIAELGSKARKHGVLADSVPPLSTREMEVLKLVAHGKTNEEIGIVLDISKKTAQHHLASAYRKLHVTGRVGATVWLAERGLLKSG